MASVCCTRASPLGTGKEEADSFSPFVSPPPANALHKTRSGHEGTFELLISMTGGSMGCAISFVMIYPDADLDDLESR